MHICTKTADAAVFTSATSEKSSDFHHSSLLVTVIQAIICFIFHLSARFLFSTVRKFCFHFTPQQLIWPFSAPVVCCLGYKALQYGIIVLYSFPSMQRRASVPWEEDAGSILHISNYRFHLPSLGIYEFSLKTPLMQLSTRINTTIEGFALTETSDLLINVCHLFPWPTFTPAYLLTKWI